MKKLGLIALTLLLSCTVLSAYAGDKNKNKQKEERNYHFAYETDTVKLTKLVDAAVATMKASIIIDAYARADVVAHGANMKQLTKNELGQILNANSLALIKISETYHIVPDKKVRSLHTPLITDPSQKFEDWEWVTQLINTGAISPRKILPVLRPKVMQQAHMAAYDPINAILVTAPYGSIKHIEQVIIEFNRQLKSHKP